MLMQGARKVVGAACEYRTFAPPRTAAPPKITIADICPVRDPNAHLTENVNHIPSPTAVTSHSPYPNRNNPTVHLQ